MSNKKFLIIGRSAVGKTAIAKGVCEKLNLLQVKSYTTRTRRLNETDENSDHYFITPEEALQYQDEIAAYTQIKEAEYFTTFSILDNSDIYVIDPLGVDDLKNRCGDKYEFIEIYIRVPLAIAKQRAKKRKDNLKAFESRRADEDEQFKNYEASRSFHYHLINIGTLDEAINKVSNWIENELRKEEN